MNEKKKPLTEKQIRYFVVAFIILNIVLATITVCILSQRFQTTKLERNPKFILSTWSYPDEYGQGIEVVWPYENSTGSWVPLHDPAFVFWYEETLFEVNATGNNALKIGVSANINHTLFDFGPDKADNASARAIMRVGIEVSNSSDIVFSLSNMTWDGSVFDDTATTWAISYADVINVLLVAGQIYTATITYEIYYETIEYGGPYLHDCSNLDNITYHSNSGLDPTDYGIGSNGSIVEMWITPDSATDEKVIYKLDFDNINNPDGDINLTVRYRVEDGFIGFRLDLYYDDATSDSTGLQTSQTWSNLTIDADSGKVLDYVLLYCDDNPASVTSGNRSVYIDIIEITNPTDTLEYFELRWNTISTAILYFSILLDFWPLNMSLIFCGLILMIGSACIVAKKVRDRTINTDNILLFLLLFFVGWALFAGGGVLG